LKSRSKELKKKLRFEDSARWVLNKNSL